VRSREIRPKRKKKIKTTNERERKRRKPITTGKN
jgi:hypothetical protein